MRGMLLVAAALCGLAAAHEIGTTRADVRLDGRRYDVTLVTDSASLLEKMGGAWSPAMFEKRVHLAFDGSDVRPDIAYAVEGNNAVIHLRGEAPEGGRQFTWNYGWTFATYALTVHAGGSQTTVWLEGNQPSAPFALAASESHGSTFRRYLALGFTHILPYGFDHVLFVLGIYLLSRRARPVLAQVSAFTVAHSITLGLSMYGVISLPSRVVEPAIAVSIAYVAIENLFLAELKSWRVALVFCFGLLHGMGFAGALRELGLPRSEFLTALLSFNLGVEGGQLAVIGTAFLLVGWQFSNRTWYRARVVIPASLAIAVTAIYWTFERIWT